MTRRKSVLVCLILLATAGMLTRWIDHQRRDGIAGFTPLQGPLSEIPQRLGSWVFTQDLPIESDVLRTADVDEFIHRTYVDPSSGRQMVLYIGYWGRENIGMGHGPDVCYPAVGWANESDAVEKVIRVEDPSRPIDARIALHRFARWGPYEAEKIAVAFTAVVDGEFRASSVGSFTHRPRRLYKCGGPFLAHVQVATPVADGEWDAAETEALSFFKLLLPALERCLPQTDCNEPA